MPTEHDIFAIKERIRDILQADTTNLYDATPSDDTKISSIEAGGPNPAQGREIQQNYIFVTNNQQGRLFNSQATSGTSGKKLLNQTMRFDIVVGVYAPDPRSAEEKLDDFVKIILENLEADEKLVGGGSALVDDSVPDRVIYDPESRGTLNPKAIITLKCVGGTS